MAKSLTHQVITSRAFATGVPPGIVKPILQKWKIWCRCSGSEWAVSHMKDVKQWIILRKSGLQPSIPWIAKSRHGNMSGCFGLLEAWMFKHPDNFKRGIQLLQIYTSLVSKAVTRLQRTKFVSAVTAPPPNRDAVMKMIPGLRKACRKASLHPRFHAWSFRRLIDFPISSARRAPKPGCVTTAEGEGFLDTLLLLTRTRASFLHYLKYRHWYDKVLMELRGPLHKYLETDDSQTFLAQEWTGETIPDLVVGQIGLIQEPGYKLRAVANPGRIFQRVLEPLQRSLLSLIDTLAWDCTHDQTRGIPTIQDALSRGKTVYSVDLSNATDYFPLELQVSVLQYLFPDGGNPLAPSLVSLFEELSKGQWWMPGYGYIQWNRGQPLGLNPSFPAFALTHGLLLLSLCDGQYNHQYFVLGDDVVILDSDLYAKYRQALDELGCPVSEMKSLQSNSLAEFAGKLITKDAVIPQYKYRNISDDSFLDIARIVGPKGLRLFKRRQRHVIQNVASVPEALGGLGWNPKGLPLEDRLAPWCFDDTYQPHPRLTSLSETRIHRMMDSRLIRAVTEEMYKVCLPVNHLLPPDDLDQRSRFLFGIHCPVLQYWSRISGKNLDMVFHLLDKELDLPIQEEGGDLATSRRKATTLTMWERKLHSSLVTN